MKNVRKIITLLLITCIFTAQVVVAEGVPSKDETVYANLTSSGTVKGIYVVNVFKTKGSSMVLDYGNYTNIKNLSSAEKPKIKSGYIEWKVPENKDTFSYQGEMSEGEFPWNFSFTYTLDGKPADGEKIVGKSGEVGIVIQARVNEKADSYFKENYLAQVAVPLDTDICSAINAPDAIMSNVGSTKTLTFMVLPGMDKTYEISFKAKKFEMDSATIGLVKVSDGIMGSVDNVKTDISKVAGNISSLIGGTGELKNGAQDLAGGLSMLNSGAQSLNQIGPSVSAGMSELETGFNSLGDGASQLTSGSTEIRNGLLELDSNSCNISKGIGQISDGLAEMTKNKQTIKSGLTELEKSKSNLTELTSGAKTLKSGYAQIESGLGTMAGNAKTINDGLKDLNSQKSAMNSLPQTTAMVFKQAGLNPTQQYILGAYINTLVGKMSQLYGAATTFGNAAQGLAEGANTAYTNMQTLNSGFNTLYNGMGKVNDLYNAADRFGNSSLALIEGAQKLQDGTGELQSGFDSYADGVGDLAENYVTMDNGLFELENGVNTLKNGFSSFAYSADGIFSSMNELTDSIGTLDRGASLLYNGTEEMNSGVSSFGSAIEGVDINSLISMSESAQPVSFAAPGVVTPDSVMFVMKTPDLHIKDAEKPKETTEKTNFWNKLIALFTGGK
ncbi:MAG: hypothetical protein Q8873_05080 [Bacillota bacterium]|nr:hypothetical protein [Bacillota bacterium]